jgi:hypothetical protein
MAEAQMIKPLPVKGNGTVLQNKEGHGFRCICGSSLPLDPIIQVAFSSFFFNLYIMVSIE